MAMRRLSSRLFYNRSEELKGLRDMVSGQDGSLILVTGPPDSGKSALLSEFMSRERRDNHTYPIHIDMRSGTYDTAASFGKELKAQASYNFVPAARKYLQKLCEEEKADADANELKQLTKDVLDSADAVEKLEGTDMQELLKQLEFLFTGWRSLARIVTRGIGGYPTLVIDEANRLQEWTLTAAEEKNFMTLQAWLLMVTKQMGIANVILCSSEDFFKFWMESHFGKDRYLVGVVGDLTEEEAFTFFKEQLKNQDVPPELWKEIFNYIGGRINLLKLIARQLSWAGDGEGQMQAAWERGRRFMEAKSWAEITEGMQPGALPHKWTPVLGIPIVSPRWTAEEFKLLLTKLTEAEDGVCSFKELRDGGIRKEALFSLVQHNFLHYREGSLWGGRDLKWYQGRYPIVMPVSWPKFHAMKQVLKEMSETRESKPESGLTGMRSWSCQQ